MEDQRRSVEQDIIGVFVGALPSPDGLLYHSAAILSCGRILPI
jgi:hypothetical protein